MKLETSIKNKVENRFQPKYFEIINESANHSGPAEESHFKLIIVSSQFDDLSLIQRHRSLNKLLAEELQQGVHALALHLFTPNEWEKNPQAKASPDCRGGSKS